jgi:hypothetical protein
MKRLPPPRLLPPARGKNLESLRWQWISGHGLGAAKGRKADDMPAREDNEPWLAFELLSEWAEACAPTVTCYIGRRGAYLAHRYTSRDVLLGPVDET